MRRLLEEWAPRVYCFALRLTLNPHKAEDLAQEALLRAWERRRQLRNASGIGSWLFRITANLWKDHLRREKSAGCRLESLTDELPERLTTVLECLQGKEEFALAMATLDVLPDRQRQVLYLNACEGLSTKEISEILDISTDAVKSNLSFARKRIRQLLDEQTSLKEPTDPTAR